MSREGRACRSKTEPVRGGRRTGSHIPRRRAAPSRDAGLAFANTSSSPCAGSGSLLPDSFPNRIPLWLHHIHPIHCHHTVPTHLRDRPSRTSPAVIDAIREAANSIARGIPSRRRQISTTAPTSSAVAIEKRGATLWARSTNRLTAAESIPPLRSSEGTGHTCSSATLSPLAQSATVRIVATSREGGEAPRRD